MTTVLQTLCHAEWLVNAPDSAGDFLIKKRMAGFLPPFLAFDRQARRDLPHPPTTIFRAYQRTRTV
ncbi:MAG: hypothetical protein IPH08_18110 [Rhodocyclaceae bacterium]|nr:hypothetical protein [Rhodocyclaceae bacterium]MBK6908913.1 hypothetical protein [Rhodocyclaceae bacterium]